jgi:hypothetical protein
MSNDMARPGMGVRISTDRGDLTGEIIEGPHGQPYQQWGLRQVYAILMDDTQEVRFYLRDAFALVD